MTAFSCLPNCPDCGCRLSVDETNHVMGNTFRKLRCKCGQRFESQETIARRLPSVPTGGHRTVQSDTGARPPPQATTGPSVSAEGVGGGLPSGSGVVVSPVFDPVTSSSLLEKPRARARSNSAAEYTAEWEAVWLVTDRTGSKHDAFVVWKRVGSPSAEAVGAGWQRWCQLDRWRRGFVPDVVKWLRGRCWEQEPREVVARQGAAAKSDENIDNLLAWNAKAAR